MQSLSDILLRVLQYRLALKALEIDDALPQAHLSLGSIKWMMDRDFLGADAELKRASELDPSLEYACDAVMLPMFMGRHDEAIARWKRNVEVSPTDCHATQMLGTCFYFARQYDEAIEQLQKALDLESNYAPAHFVLGLCYEQKGMYQEAIAEIQKPITLSGFDPFPFASLGHTYAVSGMRDKARETIKELKERSEQSGRLYLQPYLRALIETGLGNKDGAFEWLERGYQDSSVFMGWLNVDPRLDSLRSDPRFTDLLRRLRLAP
jgi:tetratricopeptide (TPR) repeat protein